MESGMKQKTTYPLVKELDRPARRRSLTISALIGAFRSHLIEVDGYSTGNTYHQHARRFVVHCLQQEQDVNYLTLETFLRDKPTHQRTPLVVFLHYYESIGSPTITSDKTKPTLPPAENELILGYLDDAKTTLRGERSRHTYQQALNSFFQAMNMDLEEGLPAGLNASFVVDYLDQMKARRLSAFTQNTHLSAIRGLAAWCISQSDALHLSPQQIKGLQGISNIKRRQIDRSRYYKESLTTAEREQLLNETLEPRDLALLTLLAFEGLRTVEICRLRLGDLQFEKKKLLILGKGSDTLKPVKFFEACQSAVRVYLQSEHRWPIQQQPAQAYLFPNEQGDRLQTYQVRYIVDKALKRIGLKMKGYSAHSLRHTVAQLLLEQDVSIETIKVLLRHESIETTMTYTLKKVEEEAHNRLPD